jgi:hypothetical protein
MRVLVLAVAAGRWFVPAVPNRVAFLQNPVRPEAPDARESSRASRDVQMFGLFGNTGESKLRRDGLSLRDARPGDNKVTFRKPNTATEGLNLGLKFREGFGKAVYIDKILPNTEADRLKKQGKINEGDEITMVSATFGDEMWSARGVGKYRLEKSIAVRQGMTISFVLEAKDADNKKRMAQMAKEQERQAVRMTRLQKQLADEVEAEKDKGATGGWWR